MTARIVDDGLPLTRKSREALLAQAEQDHRNGLVTRAQMFVFRTLLITDKRAIPTYKHICRHSQCSRSTVGRALKTFVELGLISKDLVK